MILANIVLDTFYKGGVVMYPIVVTLTVALTVVIERAIWWTNLKFKEQPEKLDEVYVALEGGNIQKASNIAKDSQDPILQVIWHGLNHHHTSLQNALQVSAGLQLEKAGRFLSILDTIITLAPLLGLLGTVTGIYGAFHSLGNEDVQAAKVGSGVAEALIATASGLTIAIFTLIPYNYFSAKVAKFTFKLQTAATNVEVLLESAKGIPHAIEINQISNHETAFSYTP